MTAAAVAFGKLWRLDCADGTWMCAGCGAECPFHVSLHCDWCLQQARNRRVEWLLREARRSPEDRRWEGMGMAIATDSRLDQDGALRLLDKASALNSSTTERMTVLRLAYARRFDKQSTHASTFAARSLPEDAGEVWDT